MNYTSMEQGILIFFLISNPVVDITFYFVACHNEFWYYNVVIWVEMGP